MKLLNRIAFLLSLSALAPAVAAQDRGPAFLNQELGVDERVEDLIGRLTLTQKAQLLNHNGPTVVVDGFPIRSDRWNQCLHGVKWTEPTTVFPTSIAFGAMWNEELMYEIAEVISDEARAIYNGWRQDPDFRGEHKGLIYRSPVVNISRNPYWGRINEIYSEDPYLTARMGMAFVKGIQGNDPKYLKLAATLKHYAVNNVEQGRKSLSCEVSERMLHEYWLPHFRTCVVEGGAQSLMASYNAINGTPNNINRYLLTDILKEDWGHEGFVVSDLGGVQTMVEGHEKNSMSYSEAVGRSLMAGCDFSDKEFEQYIPYALFDGYLTEERLDDALRRVLKVRMRLGEFDEFSSVPYSSISPDVICAPEHRRLALESARESVVLLKNNGILPLDPGKLKSIAVIGPRADIFNHGNYAGIAKNPVTPLQGIRKAAGEAGVEVRYAQGAEIIRQTVRKGRPIVKEFVREEEIARAVELARNSDVAVVFVGTTSAVECEGRDRTSLVLPGNQQELVDAVMKANRKTVVVLMSAGPLAVPSVKRSAAAALQLWWPGEEGGTAIADVLFGRYNPAGRLPYTMYASDAQVPPVDEYDISKGFTYMYLKDKPLWAFGHGLGYSSFSYSDLKLSKRSYCEGEQIRLSLTVKNTGKMTGDEVVQLYVRDLESSVVRPLMELRGFDRITLNPSESRTVEFTVPVGDLAFYDESIRGFRVEPGRFELLVGASSDDIRLKTNIIIQKQSSK